MMNEKNKNTIIRKVASLNDEKIRKWFKTASDLNTAETDVRKIADEIIGYLPLITLPIASHRFYRARLWESILYLPETVTQLLAPPPDKTTRNRCNLDKKPLLYITDSPWALVPESHIKEGQYYVVLQFDAKTDFVEGLSCICLGIEATDKFESDARTTQMIEFERNFFGKHYKKVRKLQRALHKSFVCDNDFSGLTYRLTSNISDLYFEKTETLEGIFYPSIATKGNAHNLAIKPESWKRDFQIAKAGLFQLTANNESKQLDGALVKTDGSLSWGYKIAIDNPVPVGIREIQPNNPNIYIAPWHKT